jgi:broad specificity phosphatase PhoE
MGPGIFYINGMYKEMGVKQLLLIRHCESSYGLERYVGKTDPPLSQAGVAQARKLAKRLKAQAVGHLLTSPSVRALETARLATQGTKLAIEQDSDLREIDFGRWEGMTFREIAARDPDLVEQWALSRMDFCFPEGESLMAFRERISRAGQRMCQLPDEIVAAVTHGGVIRFLLCHFFGLAPRSHLMFEINPGSITRIHFQDGSAVLSGLNDCCHMEDS